MISKAQVEDAQKNELEFEKISKIESTQLQFNEIIGEGSFGKVWNGKWRLTQVAIKQIKRDIIDEKSNFKLMKKDFAQSQVKKKV